MPVSSAVVLVIDRLGAGWLGPYGNTWLDTPHFNRLASHSLLCEAVLAESPDLATTYRGYWSGLRALQSDSCDTTPLPIAAAAAGARSVLITDDRGVAQHPLATSFAECELLEPSSVGSCSAEIEQTNLFRLFSTASNAVRDLNHPTLLWIHAAGMSAPWDAPLELRNRFADEDDPLPPAFVDPPNRLLKPGFDPDELLGIVHAYAGQVALLDLCLGMLLEALDEHPLASDTLFVATSPRGYPLGEHLRIGPCDDALYGELLHVPLFLRLPADRREHSRTRQLIQPHELCAAIANVCGWPSNQSPSGSALLAELRGEPSPPLSAAFATAQHQRAIRTHAWFLRESRHEDRTRHELFAKPDDRWEANEISSRCTEETELLASYVDQFEQAVSANKLAELPPLADSLCEMWR